MTRIFLKSFALNSSVLKELQFRSERRGITVQEFLRAVVIPFYLDLVDSPAPSKAKKYSLRVKKGWETRRKKQEEAELAAKNEEFPPYPAGPTK